ncbi:MAG TPA: phosphate acyltransferase, partial [Longimicrobium sp.]|nr:phosphate acyltransferase [Longimicrobium sp.]
MSFLDGVRRRARANLRRIVFPEGADERTLEAVVRLSRDTLAIPIVIGGELTAVDLDRMGAPQVQVVDPAHDIRRPAMAALLHQRRGARGMTEE